MMLTISERAFRIGRTAFLCIALVFVAGCYAKMYDDPSIDKQATALIRGPIGPGFPMQLTIKGTEKPNRTTRIPAGNYTFDVKWIGETDAPPDFAQGHLLRVPFQCSMTYDIKAGKKYDVAVVGGRASLYEYNVSKLTGARRDGAVVESCEGAYVGCCP
jgi:hypothetical protein